MMMTMIEVVGVVIMVSSFKTEQNWWNVKTIHFLHDDGTSHQVKDKMKAMHT